jgi:hypothetical protein
LPSCRRDHDAVLFAFDLIEHRGGDLHNAPLLHRKRQLAKLLGDAKHAIRFNEHLAHGGATMFEHVCRMAWRASYQSGSMRHIAAAVKDVAEIGNSAQRSCAA